MSSRRVHYTLKLAAIMMVIGGSAMASEWQVGWHSIDGGAGMRIHGGGWTLHGTSGQCDAGELHSANGLKVVGGFWGVGVAPAMCTPPAFATGQAGLSANAYLYDGYVDPRRESSNGAEVNQGLDRLTVRFTTPLSGDQGTPVTAESFRITDTAGNAPGIVEVYTNDNATFTIQLDRIISPAAWTTIEVHSVRSACNGQPFAGSLDIGFLPCDADNNGRVNPLDLLRFRQYVQGSASPPAGTAADRTDMDRNGVVTPLDLLIFRQLINNVPPATQSWNGVELPPQP